MQVLNAENADIADNSDIGADGNSLNVYQTKTKIKKFYFVRQKLVIN